MTLKSGVPLLRVCYTIPADMCTKGLVRNPMKPLCMAAALLSALFLSRSAAGVPIPALPSGRTPVTPPAGTSAPGAVSLPAVTPMTDPHAGAAPYSARMVSVPKATPGGDVSASLRPAEPSPAVTPAPSPGEPSPGEAALLMAPTPAAVATSTAAEPAGTEFLERWDREYRLLDPEVEPARRGAARDYARGVAELKKAILTGIPDEGMYYRLGFCYEKLGDNDRALDAYRRAMKNSGGAYACAIPYHLGLVLAGKGDHAEAAAEFEKALACPEYAAAARNNLGNCYRSLYLKRKALEEFAAAIELDPRMAGAHLNMGVTRAELGDREGSVSSLRRALELDPHAPGAAYSLGIVLRAMGDARGAEEALARAVKISPRDEKAHLALARLYVDAGRKEEARQEARIAFGLMPMLRADNLELDNALGASPPPAAATPSSGEGEERALLDQARSALSTGDHAGAERAYEAVLRRNPNSVAASLGMAYLGEFAGAQRYGKGFPAERSIGFYRKALDAQPGMSTAWFSLGNVYEKCGRYEEAAAAFAKACACAPEMRFAWYNLGVCYAKLGDHEKAEAQFREAVRLDPDFADARFQLGEALAAKRDFGGAIGEYEKVLSLTPAHADSHFSLAQIYRLQAADRRKAAGHFRTYLELRPNAPDASEVEGWIREMGE